MARFHKIQKLTFNIETCSENAAKEELQLIDSIIKRRLLASIEKVFDEQGIDKQTLKIDKLELDLGTIDMYQLDSELEFKLRKSLSGSLIKILEANPDQLQHFQASISPEENIKSEWLSQFLKTGIMPWWQEESMPSKDFIKKAIVELFESHSDQLIKLIESNLKYPQFTKRLISYSSEQFIVETTSFYPDLMEKWIENSLWLLKDQYHYTQLSFQNLWKAVVESYLKHPPNSRNKALLVGLVVKEITLMIEKKESLSEAEAVILLKSGTRYLSLESALKKEIEFQFNKSTFNSKTFEILSPSFTKVSGKNIWFLDALHYTESFINLLQNKAFRYQIISKLSERERRNAIINLQPSYSKILQNIYSFTDLILTIENISATRSKQIRVFTEDLILKNINAKTWKTKDQTAIFYSIISYIAELSVKLPGTILKEIKHAKPENFLKAEWIDSITQIEVFLKVSEQKGTSRIGLKSEAEQIIQFILTGQNVTKKTPEIFKEQLLATIQYLLGATKPSNLYKERDAYQKQFSSQTQGLSALEIALIVDRIKQLPLKEIEKKQLLEYAFRDHPLAEIIIRENNKSLIKWFENTKNLAFLIQYLVKFNRLPLNITMDPQLFLVVTTLKKQFEIIDVAKYLDLPTLSTLIHHFEKVKETSLSTIQMKQLAIVADVGNLTSSEIKLNIKEVYTKLKQLMKFEVEISDKKMVTEAPTKKLSEELEKLAEKELDSNLYIQNAGVVLLAPYLSQLFNKLELLNKEGLWKNDNCQIKAVELIHFLTFGTDEMMEYTCILNKLLVSMPISLPLETEISLTIEEKTLCESLLTAVISNWSALKSSSIDNLRGSFLIREGRLSKHDDRYDLKVEDKGFDKLLDKVPWSFKLVKYKWMKKPVFVDWR